MPQSLPLGVFPHEGAGVFAATGQVQVVDSDFINGEDSGSRTELRRHIADSGAVS